MGGATTSSAREAHSPGAASRGDRAAILSALAAVTALAWSYLVWTAGRMSGRMMEGPLEMVRIRAWESADFLFIFLMWAIMMVGMMVPTAIPLTLIYAGVVRKGAQRGTVVPPTLVFVSGYVAVWTLFSGAATLAQWGLDRAALLSPLMVTTSPAIGAGLLIAAGTYQITPLKEGCLLHCRSPAHFLSTHWRPGVGGAFRLGVVQGAYCLGCCGFLMGLLFVGGVMNLLWIATIAVFVLLEKVLPRALLPARVGGAALIVTGCVLLITLL